MMYLKVCLLTPLKYHTFCNTKIWVLNMFEKKTDSLFHACSQIRLLDRLGDIGYGHMDPAGGPKLGYEEGNTPRCTKNEHNMDPAGLNRSRVAYLFNS